MKLFWEQKHNWCELFITSFRRSLYFFFSSSFFIFFFFFFRFAGEDTLCAFLSPHCNTRTWRGSRIKVLSTTSLWIWRRPRYFTCRVFPRLSTPVFVRLTVNYLMADLGCATKIMTMLGEGRPSLFHEHFQTFNSKIFFLLKSFHS